MLTDVRVYGIQENMRMETEVSADDVRKVVKMLKKGRCLGWMRLQVRCFTKEVIMSWNACRGCAEYVWL